MKKACMDFLRHIRHEKPHTRISIEHFLRKERFGMEINMARNVGIIGAGAAGMTAAIAAAREGAKVTLFERNDRVGKKILMTGNGRCNLGNRALDSSMYHADQPDFVSDRLGEFGTDDTISFFNGLGLMIRDRNGYLYPACEQASAVLDVLRNEISGLGVRVMTNCKITRLEKRKPEEKIHLYSESNENGFGNKWTFDRVIVACGGMAAPSTGSDGNGYALARGMGHFINPTVPALVQLRCSEKFFKSISGVRADAYVAIRQNGREIAADRGELQLTDYGISGIPVFQISRTAAYLLKENKGKNRIDKSNKEKNDKGLEVHIDFLPDISADDYEAFCNHRKKMSAGRNVEEFFTGMLNKKLMQLFIRMADLKGEENFKTADKEKIDRVFSLCRDLKVTVVDTNPFANAQVTAGGIPLKEISGQFESRKMPGVYFAGEILDVDGKCGGYNLQWAWCSGYTAGVAAALH